jgi:hypothetical protein
MMTNYNLLNDLVKSDNIQIKKNDVYNLMDILKEQIFGNKTFTKKIFAKIVCIIDKYFRERCEYYFNELDDDESYNFDFTFSNVDKKTILKNAKALLSKEQYDELLKKEGLASSQMVSWIKENDKEKFWLFVSSLTNDIDNYGKILEFLDWELETETSDEDDEAIDFND